MHHGKFRLRAISGIDHIQIFLQRRIDRHHRAILRGGLEAPLLRIQHHNWLLVAQHFDQQPLRGVVLFRFGVEALQNQSVRPDLHAVALPHVFLQIAFERRSGQPDENKHHTHMNDVSAITPRIAHRKLNCGSHKRSSRPRARSVLPAC